MEQEPSPEITSFVFSDPGGKRWPRLRLALLIGGIAIFLGTVLFVQTLFVAPQLNLPFSLRQLKGQLKSLQTVNPAGQPPINLAHSSLERQDRFIQKVLATLNEAKAAGVVIDWEQVDPAYKKDITAFLDR